MKFRVGDVVIGITIGCARDKTITITGISDGGYHFTSSSHSCWEPQNKIETGKLKERTMENLEVGDVLSDGYRNVTVLGVAGKVVFLSEGDLPDELNVGAEKTIEQLVDRGYTIKSEEDVEELTVEQISERLGKTIKVVK